MKNRDKVSDGLANCRRMIHWQRSEKENMHMDELKLLILGVGGNVSQGIIKALKNSDFGETKLKLVGACISPQSLGLFMCDKAEVSPYANEEAFLPWLINLCSREQIQMVLTGVEENILAISEQAERFQRETDAVFIASDTDKLEIGQDKYLTCKWLAENGLHYPGFCLADQREAAEKLVREYGFPIIAKPRNGKGSNGVAKIETEAELEAFLGKSDYVLQECIGDETKEYTVGCYVDKSGILRETIVMHRRLEHGSTAMAQVVKDEAVQREAERICKAFAPRGPLNIQMRKNAAGEAVCFELNVRFSGTTPMRTQFGFKDVEAMVKEYLLDEPIDDCFQVREGIACRYTNEFYVTGNPMEQLRQEGRIDDMEPFGLRIERLGKQ